MLVVLKKDKMTQTANTNRGAAASVVLMFLMVMAGAWMAYSWLFPQDVLTFLIMLVYIPVVGVIAALLYRYLRCKL